MLEKEEYKYSLIKDTIIGQVKDMFPEEISEYFDETIEIIGDATKIGKIVKIIFDIKNIFFMKKFKKFIKNIDESNTKKELFFKLEEDPKKFSEKLLIILDNIDFLEKINYLTELFIMYANKDISKKEFFRCCKILESNNYYDIKDFKNKDKFSTINNDDNLFLFMGLLQSSSKVDGTYGGIGHLSELTLSKAGEIFIEINKKITD